MAFSAVAGDGSHLELFAGSMCAARGEGRAPACCGAPAAVLYGLELGAARRPVLKDTNRSSGSLSAMVASSPEYTGGVVPPPTAHQVRPHGVFPPDYGASSSPLCSVPPLLLWFDRPPASSAAPADHPLWIALRVFTVDFCVYTASGAAKLVIEVVVDFRLGFRM